MASKNSKNYQATSAQVLAVMLDGRSGWIFLAATFFLTVFISSIYDMVRICMWEPPEGGIGNYPARLVYLGICGSIGFAGICLLWNRIKKEIETRFSRPAEDVVEREVLPHKGLVFAVSCNPRNEPGIEQAQKIDLLAKACAIHWHTLTHLWLLHSTESEYIAKYIIEHPACIYEEIDQKLKDKLQAEHGITGPMGSLTIILEKLADIGDPQAAASKVDAIYLNAKPLRQQELIADVTGMTKAVSIGIALACFHERRRLQYFEPAKQRIIGIELSSADAQRYDRC